MTDPANTSAPETNRQSSRETKWGPKLFIGVFVAVLVFFWWLLIYSHGVVPHHG